MQKPNDGNFSRHEERSDLQCMKALSRSVASNMKSGLTYNA